LSMDVHDNISVLGISLLMLLMIALCAKVQ
jgi:hypothetical protein